MMISMDIITPVAPEMLQGLGHQIDSVTEAGSRVKSTRLPAQGLSSGPGVHGHSRSYAGRNAAGMVQSS